MSSDSAYDEALSLHRGGRIEQAARAYQLLLEREPDSARLWHLLGLTHHQRGDSATAITLIEKAIALRGDNAVYFGNLGLILRELGRSFEAIAPLQRGVELDPHYIDCRVNLASVLTAICRADLAIEHLRTALAQRPTHVAACIALGLALSELGDAVGARDAYLAAHRLRPSAAVRVLAAIQLPPVYRSHAELEAWRNQLEAELDRLLSEGVCVDLTEEVAMPIFSLAHQGMNDVGIMRKYARLFRAPPLMAGIAEGSSAPSLGNASTAVHRIGFISAYFRDHTIGKLMRGFIEHLDRREFHVTVFSIGHHADPLARGIAEAADRYVELPTDAVRARPRVAAEGLDLLFYTDIGMCQITQTLAHSRLAPVQCVSWGHPDTTGLDTIDDFVSSVLYESEESDGHYTERLIRLPAIPMFYHKPNVPDSLPGRSALGIPEAAHVYCCPQSIYKFHPDFDPLLAEILRRDPQGELVLIAWMYPEPDRVLLERWRRTMPDVVPRIRFVPRLSQGDFMNLLAASDVLLDPVRFGGGNTSVEAIALGTPIVTLPDAFMRSRITAACLQQMELGEFVARSAAEYVDLAVRLGTDPAYRTATRARILAAHDKLFENVAAVRALEEYFRTRLRHVKSAKRK